MEHRFFRPELNDIRKEILLLISIPDLLRMANTTNLRDRKRLVEILFKRAKEPAAQPYIHRFLREFNTTPSPLIPPLNIILQSLPNLNFRDNIEGLNFLAHTFQDVTPFESLKNNCLKNINPKETMEELGRNANAYTTKQISVILDFLLKEVLKGSNGFFSTPPIQQQCLGLIRTLIKYLPPNELDSFKDYYAIDKCFSAQNPFLRGRIISIFADHMTKDSPLLSNVITDLIDNMTNSANKKIAFKLLSQIRNQLNNSQKAALLPLTIDILEDQKLRKELFLDALGMLSLFSISDENHKKITTSLISYIPTIQHESNLKLAILKAISPLLGKSNQYNSVYIKILFSLLNLDMQNVTKPALLSFLDSFPWIENKDDKLNFLTILIRLLTETYFDVDAELENQLKKMLDYTSLELINDDLLAKLLTSINPSVRTIAFSYLKEHAKERADFIKNAKENIAPWISLQAAQPLIFPETRAFKSEIALWNKMIIENTPIYPNWHMICLLALISEVPDQSNKQAIEERKKFIQRLLIEITEPSSKQTEIFDLLDRLHKTKQLDIKEETQLFDYFVENCSYYTKEADNLDLFFWKHLPLFPAIFIREEKEAIVSIIVEQIMSLAVNARRFTALRNSEPVFRKAMLLAERGECEAILVEELIKKMSKTIIQPFHDALNEPKIRYSFSQTIYHLWITIEDSELITLTSLVNIINDRQADVRIRVLFLNTCSSWLTYTLNNNLGLIEKAAEIINSQKSSTDEITHLQGCMRLIMQIKPRIINQHPKDEPEASPNNPKII